MLLLEDGFLVLICDEGSEQTIELELSTPAESNVESWHAHQVLRSTNSDSKAVPSTNSSPSINLKDSQL